MVLHLIGLGLGDIEDLTVHGLTVISTCSKLYILASKYYPFHKEELEEYLSQELISVAPDDFEEKIPRIVLESQGEIAIALLMPGNPFCDNFYPQIKFHCQKLNVNLKVVHNMSYMNAMGNTGIQLYKFGETVFMDDASKDELESYFKIINSNLERNLNTLIIFRKEVNTNLPTELITGISNLDCKEKRLCPNSKVVLLYKNDKMRYFDYGTACLVGDINSKNIEAVAVCADFDCVEEEYLREMKSYYDGARKVSERRGNFHVIGLGLGNPGDITVRGRKLIEKSRRVFLEGYTSLMLGGKDELEKFFHKEITVADREMVEQNSDQILDHLKDGDDVSFLVVGDPLGATTHTDIILRSLENANEVIIANNASIINALGLTGLKPRKFGGTISIPFWTENYRPDSFYDKISANSEMGWHTLCLLDIQVKEQSFENLARGRKVYEKPRYMSSSVGANQLLESKDKRLEENSKVNVDENTKTVSLTRVGTATEDIPCLLLRDLPHSDLGPPLHSLVIVGKMDEDERKVINLKEYSYFYLSLSNFELGE